MSLIVNPTLYRIYAEDGTLIYLGMTTGGLSRYDGHRANSPWWREVAVIEIEHLDCGWRGAYDAERAAIKAEQPIYNRQSKLPRNPGSWQSEKTHCPQGHPYDEANTYHYKGHRQCRICRDSRVARWRERNRKVSA